MKSLQNFITENKKTVSDQMFDLLIEQSKKGISVQSTLEDFLKKCFDNAPHKDFHIEVGDAIFNIYEDYLK